MSKVLVAYFSASGTTKKAAEKVAAALDADIFEIAPEVPYTKKDLNWMNPFSRTTKEMHNKSFRPPVSGKVENMSEYDKVLIGFPIWWYIAPTIINTFLEMYDFAGKTIGLFATSGGSGFGKSIAGLSPSVDESVKWAEPKLLNGAFDDKEIVDWVEKM